MKNKNQDVLTFKKNSIIELSANKLNQIYGGTGTTMFSDFTDTLNTTSGSDIFGDSRYTSLLCDSFKTTDMP